MLRRQTSFIGVVTVVTLFTTSRCTAQEPAVETADVIRGGEATGTFVPVGPPLEKPVRVVAGKSCIVDIRQSYRVSGALSGSMEIDYRILVAGPCGSPPGTFDEEWIAHGTFTGKKNGAAVSGGFSYTARVKAGGNVEGADLITRQITE